MTPQEATEQGLKLHQAGRLEEAEAQYALALRQQPDFHPALHLMGLLRFQRGDHAGALLALDQAVATAPGTYPSLALLHASRGEVLQQSGRVEEALAAFEKALLLNPGIAAAWNNRGLAEASLGRPEQALNSFARAMALAPGSTAPHNNRGDTLRQLRRHDEALTSFAAALAIDPDDPGALTNRATTFAEIGRTAEALSDYDKALTRNPDLPEALFGRSHLLWSKKSDLKAALADLIRLARTAPDFPYAQGALTRLKMTAALWDDFSARKALLNDGVRADRKITAPFIYLSVSERPDDIHRAAKLYAKSNFPAAAASHKNGPRRPGPIRIGYVCGEFRTHATLYLMAGLFEAHDRAGFEICAFDNGGGDDGALRARFERTATRIVDITRLSDEDAAARIAAEDIDILVDLNGYVGEQRLGVFARKPAPVQVSYLAYPGTLGAPYMDYILADPVVIPKAHEGCYSEKIAWLPGSYQINDDKRVVGDTPAREDAGLPAGVFVFCNFNHVNKFTPETFTRWMRILTQVPESVLWLLKPDPLAEGNLRREAKARGVAPERLIFAPPLPLERHLGRLRLADLFLDGLPYGAHTTASDALWAGLPLITLMGDVFPGRVAASLLLALGLPELVTQSAEEFEALALKLAREPERLAALRGKIALARDTASLFDTKRTTRAIERAYRIMFENRGTRPESFFVPD